jgi:hypothetical protein
MKVVSLVQLKQHRLGTLIFFVPKFMHVIT